MVLDKKFFLVGITSYGIRDNNNLPGVRVIKIFFFFVDDAASDQAGVSAPN